jgi:uncharacterized protein YpiB (UPF0302 family)
MVIMTQMQRNYTLEDVKRYRDENSCGLYEAKAHFERERLLETIHIAHTNKDFDLLCDVVRELIVKGTRFA